MPKFIITDFDLGGFHQKNSFLNVRAFTAKDINLEYGFLESRKQVSRFNLKSHWGACGGGVWWWGGVCGVGADVMIICRGCHILNSRFPFSRSTYSRLTSRPTFSSVNLFKTIFRQDSQSIEDYITECENKLYDTYEHNAEKYEQLLEEFTTRLHQNHYLGTGSLINDVIREGSTF